MPVGTAVPHKTLTGYWVARFRGRRRRYVTPSDWNPRAAILVFREYAAGIRIERDGAARIDGAIATASPLASS
jgi:hypothetical protein